MFESVVLPSPKVHCQAVGPFVEESINETANGTIPAVWVAVKFAAGAGIIAPETAMKFDCVAVLLPPALLAVRETV
jgi:hypothetical protein